MNHLTFEAPSEFELRQAYGRHGRRHGLKGLRPNRILMAEDSYRHAYVLGRTCRFVSQALFAVSFAFIGFVILGTLPGCN